MSAIQEDDKLLIELKKKFDKIETIDVTLLIDDIRFGAFSNTVHFQNSLRNTIDLFKQFSTSNFIGMPLNLITEYINTLDNFLRFIKRIEDFKPSSGGDPQSNVNQFINETSKYYDENYLKFKLLILESKLAEKNFSSIEYELKSKLGTTNKHLSDAKILLSEIKDKAAKTAINKYSDFYYEQAKNHRFGAYGWFVAMIVFIICAFYLGYHYNEFLTLSETPSLREIVQNTLIKLILISTIFTGLALCVKNYKANRHNYIINTYKVNALNTFQLFRDSAEDNSTKNAILLQAAQSIFSIPNTGYSSVDSEPDSTSKVFEIIRSVSNNAKTN